VVGRAVNEAGEPIAKPVVEAVVPDGSYVDGVGDDDGTFALPVFLAYGQGALHAFLEARAADGRLARKEFVIRDDRRFNGWSHRTRLDVGDLVLRAPLHLDVVVVSPAGTPVVAEVYAAHADPAWAVARVVAATGKDGRGRLVGLTAEPHRIVAVALGYGRVGRPRPRRARRGAGAPVPGPNGESTSRSSTTTGSSLPRGPKSRSWGSWTRRGRRASRRSCRPWRSPSRTPGPAVLEASAPTTRSRSRRATRRCRQGAAPGTAAATGATLVTRGRSFVVVPRGETAITLHLSSRRTVEWPITAAQVRCPDGTVIRLVNPAGPACAATTFRRKGVW
jgi:hypothetical protein